MNDEDMTGYLGKVTMFEDQAPIKKINLDIMDVRTRNNSSWKRPKTSLQTTIYDQVLKNNPPKSPRPPSIQDYKYNANIKPKKSTTPMQTINFDQMHHFPYQVEGGFQGLQIRSHRR